MSTKYRVGLCRDCGIDLREVRISARRDICMGCIENRKRFIEAQKDGRVSSEEFRKAQKKMSGRSCGAKKFIESLIGATP